MRIKLFGNLVRTVPAFLITLTVALSVIFFVVSQGMERRVDMEHYLPDNKEIKAQRYISEVYTSSDTEALQIVIVGDVLNNSLLVDLYNFNKNLSKDSRVAGIISYVDLIINSYIINSVLQNFSIQGENFLNSTMNFTSFIEILEIVRNVTDNYEEARKTNVKFCSDGLFMTFIELHNLSNLQNETVNITFVIPSLGNDMQERAQEAQFLSNVIDWTSLTLDSASDMISMSSGYESEYENWSKIRQHVVENDYNSAKKILMTLRNSSNENLTLLRLGWRYVFGPYNQTLTVLYNELLEGVLNQTTINYTHQNTSTNIELARNLNLSMLERLLLKYDENLTSLWNSLNESSVEKYQVKTVSYQTLYMIQNYTMRVREMIVNLENKIEEIDEVIKLLDNGSLSAIRKIDEIICRIVVEMENFNNTKRQIETLKNIFSLNFFIYMKSSLRDYYKVIRGEFNAREKILVDNMLLSIFRLLNVSLNTKLNLILDNYSSSEFSISVEEYLNNFDAVEILRNVSLRKLIKALEELQKSYYLDLINKTSSKLNSYVQNLSYINEILKDISYVLSVSEVYVRPAMLIYESERIMVEESLYIIELIREYLPAIYELVDRSKDVVQGIKDMLSKDFDYSKASAALSIVSIYWNSVNNSEEEMVSFQKKIIRDISKRLASHNIKVMALSMSLVSEDIKPLLDEVSHIIVPLAMTLVIVFLTIVFRSILDTLLVLLCVGLSIVWMNGTAVILQIPQDQLTIVPAALVIGLGVDYGIHVIMRYREKLREGLSFRDSAALSIETVGTALALSVITTVVAFLSNITSPIPPVRNFGIMCALGILYSYFIMNLLLPSLKVIIDERRGSVRVESIKSSKIIDKATEKIADVAERHYLAVFILVGMMVVGGLYSSTKISVSFSMEDFLPEGFPTTQTIRYLENNFNVSMTSSASILYRGNISAETLKEIDRFMNELKDDPYVVYTQSDSITNYIKHWMTYNSTFRSICEDEDGDLLPDRNVSIALYWLYSHDHKNASKYYTITLNSTVITVKTIARSTEEIKILYEDLQKDARVIKSGEVIITGSPILMYVIVAGLQESMLNSLVVTLLACVILLFVVFLLVLRSKLVGLISSIPVLVVVSLIYGTMYLLGYSFNVLTVTVLALTIGMGIDYSIHISHRFLDEYVIEGLNYREASLRAIRFTGTALLASAITTIFGFASLVLSSMPPLRIFGVLSSLTIAYSLIMSIVLLPTLLTFWARGCERLGKCYFRYRS